EVEHVRLIDHGLVVEPGSALVAGHWHATEDALLDGQDELVRHALLPGHPPDELADPEPEVADGTARALEERAHGDELSEIAPHPGRLPPVANCRTWAMTMPPLFRAAMAMASISPWTASPSIVRLPSSSAVVPRMTATSIGKAW